MNWTERWTPAPKVLSHKELRNYGFVMAAAFSILGGLFLWRGRGWAVHLFWPALGFLLVGVLQPRLLRQVHRWWMRGAEALGGVVTRVILFLTFYLLITPFSVIKRIVSGDTLGLRPDPKASTYWVDVDRSGPAGRPNKPF